jgi:hypothetical protein
MPTNALRRLLLLGTLIGSSFWPIASPSAEPPPGLDAIERDREQPVDVALTRINQWVGANSNAPLDRRLRALRLKALLLLELGDETGARRAIEEIRTIGTHEPSSDAMLSAEALEADLYIRLGDTGGSVQHARLALQLIDRASDTATRAFAYGATSHALSDFPEESSLLAQQGLDALGEGGPEYERVRLLGMVAWNHRSFANPGKALRTNEMAMGIAVHARDLWGLAVLEGRQAEYLKESGDLQTSLTWRKRALARDLSLHMQARATTDMINLSDAYLCLEQWQMAESIAREALDRARFHLHGSQ